MSELFSELVGEWLSEVVSDEVIEWLNLSQPYLGCMDSIAFTTQTT